MKKYKFYGIVLLLIFSLCLPLAAAATDNPQNSNDGSLSSTVSEIANQEQKILEQINLAELQQFFQQLDNHKLAFLPNLDVRQFIDNLRNGEVDFSLSAILSGFLRYLFNEVLANTAILTQIVLLTVICSILGHLQSAFDGDTSKVAILVGHLMLIVLAIQSFQIVLSTGKEAIEFMVNFMQVLLPVLLTLLVAVGGVVSGALFHPVIFASLTFISTVIKYWVFPLITFVTALGILNHVSPQFKVGRLQSLLKDSTKLLMGFLIFLYISVIGIYGVAGSLSDGVGLRTAKFAMGVFIPVVGDMVTDTLDAIVGSSLLIQNVIGMLGALALLIMCILPSLKILALVFVYRLAGALLQPAGDSPVAATLETIGNSFTMIFGAVAAVGIMFFLAISIVVGAGNLTVMLR